MLPLSEPHLQLVDRVQTVMTLHLCGSAGCEHKMRCCAVLHERGWLGASTWLSFRHENDF